ncbi:MAG: FAD-dependent oxidoreductase [Candidatus Eremiobacteraeota bacterium]|nr:FAD-dependent oxidoreductase [Candidatus Eremiobacteraeota bacterium]
MNRRALLGGGASTALIALLPKSASSAPTAIPWDKLRRATDGRLLELHSPFHSCANNGAACNALFENIKNPYFIGDNPALTQTVGWADAWTSATSARAVAAMHAGDVAAAVNFARDYDLRPAIKGGGHSYQGTSNAPDSLLIWTRNMHDISVTGDSVTLGSGTIWAQAYDAVTTQRAKYVQGGGCTTVGVAGLIQSGGFGSFSKRFGTAASSLREAEIVTADGRIRTVNAANDPDLFWALKGGGGGTFGVVTRLMLALHDLPEYLGGVNAQIKASSNDDYRELVARFITFYSDSLFNEHWGESVQFRGDNVLAINMVGQGLTSDEMKAVWKPFFDAVKASPSKFTIVDGPDIGAMAGRHWWDRSWRVDHHSSSVRLDPRPNHATNWWWRGDSDQVGVFLYAYESLWLPASLLDGAHRSSLNDALYEASRPFGFELHFNKGLAGAPQAAIDAAINSATNPSVTTAFALAISADGAQGVYPGISGREPDMQKAHASAQAVHASMERLRVVAPNGGSYVSESNYFEPSYGTSYWGTNYPRLQSIKRTYDPHNLFAVHNGVRA